MAFLLAGGKRLEYRWLGPRPSAAPTLVFLHEGLGCVSMWRDFPERLVAATGCGAMVYSRAGYGASDAVELPRPLAYMHDEAALLPEILGRLGIERAILVGHSDGGSIALIHAGSGKTGPSLLGAITEAAHVFCEDISVRAIAAAREAWEQGDLRARLGRHHGANVDCAFLGWNRAWLDPGFCAWNIEAYLPAIAVPLLAIQGEDDEYGTMAQLDAIAAKSGGPVETLRLAACGHSPHRDQAEAVLARMAAFVAARLGHGGAAP
ncbi:MAG: alpha/beta hydrolase [Alphaproteobacteria bacterium]|nr:alpha/beta hydrolase [Alphaproteobacteria bacterium]